MLCTRGARVAAGRVPPGAEGPLGGRSLPVSSGRCGHCRLSRLRIDGEVDVHAAAQDAVECPRAIRDGSSRQSSGGARSRRHRSAAAPRNAATYRVGAACGLFRFALTSSYVIVLPVFRLVPTRDVERGPRSLSDRPSGQARGQSCGSPPLHAAFLPARAALSAWLALWPIEIGFYWVLQRSTGFLVQPGSRAQSVSQSYRQNRVRPRASNSVEPENLMNPVEPRRTLTNLVEPGFRVRSVPSTVMRPRWS